MITVDKEISNKINYLIKKKVSLSNMSKILNLPTRVLIKVIRSLSTSGKEYQINGDEVTIKMRSFYNGKINIPIRKDTIKILAISDTHLGCYQDRPDLLNYLYEEAEKCGTDLIIHCGDLVDGISHYPDQIANLRQETYEEQRDYAIEVYPHSYIPTIIVSGNHDNWCFDNTGTDIISEIASSRPDLTYIGHKEGIIQINNIKLFLFHGHRSLTTIQDNIDNENPDLLFRGHSHTYNINYPYTYPIIQIPCLVNERIHPNCHNAQSEKGAWWIELEKNGELEVEKELELFPTRKLVRNK